MKTNHKLSDSLEAALKTIIDADSENWSAKGKLRLLKICQSLCPADTVFDEAILLCASRPLDDLIYDLLGHGTKRARLSLFELADPETSTILEALEVYERYTLLW